MRTYQLTCEGYVIRDGDTKVPIVDTPEFPNMNPDYLAYKAWLVAGGVPEPVDASSIAALLEQVKDDLRVLREPMLDAVNGIGWRASMTGNTALANEAVALAEALLDITSDAALNAAMTYEDMRAAGVAAYKRLAATASPALVPVFREITVFERATNL